MVEDFRLTHNALWDDIAKNRDFAEFHLNIGRACDDFDEIDTIFDHQFSQFVAINQNEARGASCWRAICIA